MEPHARDAEQCAVNGRTLRKRTVTFGETRPVGTHDTDRSRAYVGYMLSTLLVIGGVLVGLLVLLAVIVTLSARPSTERGRTSATRTAAAPPSWVVNTGQPHPDAWAPLSHTSTEIRAIR